MKINRLIFFLFISLAFLSCKKDSGSKDSGTQYGTKLNTWTFKEGSKQFSGLLLFDAQMNTMLQSNNTYTFGMIGPENSSGYMFTINLSLLDLNFNQKTYQSGVDGNDYINAFFYTELGSVDDIYKSSNLDPGPVMNYTITAYDASKDIVTITFSGKAQLANRSFVDITEGKVTAHIER
jgi:hypothetical protein